MTWIRFGRIAAAACVVGLVAVGCGDSEDPAPNPTAATTGAGAGMQAPGTIPEVADAAGDFTTLLAAVEAAGLGDTISSPGPFTVFAPTDAAFAKIPQADLDAILADQELLTAILTYHVVPGEVPSGQVTELTSATTVQGEDISIAVSDGNVILNDASTVTTVDVDASNGVIHVIDTVLIPPSIAMGGGGGAGGGN